MNETIVRAALRDATDGLEPYDLLAPALRQARRRRLSRLVAAPTAVVIAAALALLGWAQAPTWSEPTGASKRLAGLPDHLHDPRSRTSSVSNRPPGPVAVAYTGGSYASYSDRLYVMLSGPAGYRVTDRWSRDEVHPGEDVLLSPAGDHLVYYDKAMRVLDLRTGRTRTLPNEVGRESEPLAWAPDNRTVAVAVAPGLGPDGRRIWRGLGLLDTVSGEYRSLANPPGLFMPGFAVAFNPDGGSLAYQGDNHVFVVGLDGVDRWNFYVDEGNLLAGKAAFTPGGAVAVSVREGCCQHHFEYYTAADRPRERTAAVPDTTALRLVGWFDRETPVAVAFRPVRGYHTLPRSVPTTFDVVRRADVVTVGSGGALILTTPDVAAVDVAEQAITGVVVRAPAAPDGLPPPFPLGWPDLWKLLRYVVAVFLFIVAVGLVHGLVQRHLNST
jgi:hypothetical protein